LHIETLVTEEEPRKGFYEPGLRVIEPETRQKDLFRMSKSPGTPSIDVAGIAQPGELRLNPPIGHPFTERELHSDWKRRRGHFE
jgi:hypothetical protein